MADAPRDPMRRAGGEPSALLAPAERDQTIARLSDAFAHDLLPMDELERRLAAVYRASTAAELGELTADLPARSAAAVVAPDGAPPAPAFQRIAAFLGNVERGGYLIVPAQLEIRVVAGNVELDLTDARFAAGVTEIAVRAFMGNVEIKLPAGVHVENHGGGFLGSFDCRVPVPPGRVRAGTPVVRITGRAVLSSVEIVSAAGFRALDE